MVGLVGVDVEVGIGMEMREMREMWEMREMREMWGGRGGRVCM